MRAGVVLILICIAGRTWCTLYIGGLKKKQLVTQGPYSLVRNPLYVFTIIGVAGVGAQAGSITMPVGLALLVAIVFYAVALQEQAFLADTFGDEYRAYAERVPLFFPRFSTWQEADQLLVMPVLVRRTFMDASLFLLAVPVNDLIQWLQDDGWVPVLRTCHGDNPVARPAPAPYCLAAGSIREPACSPHACCLRPGCLGHACSAAASAQIADRCLAVSQAPRLIQPVALKKSEVRLTFVGHSTWLIESAAGVSIATDYNDYVRPPVVPISPP